MVVPDLNQLNGVGTDTRKNLLSRFFRMSSVTELPIWNIDLLGYADFKSQLVYGNITVSAPLILESSPR